MFSVSFRRSDEEDLKTFPANPFRDSNDICTLSKEVSFGYILVS
jgi:hypothetical protein